MSGKVTPGENALFELGLKNVISLKLFSFLKRMKNLTDSLIKRRHCVNTTQMCENSKMALDLYIRMPRAWLVGLASFKNY